MSKKKIKEIYSTKGILVKAEILSDKFKVCKLCIKVVNECRSYTTVLPFFGSTAGIENLVKERVTFVEQRVGSSSRATNQYLRGKNIEFKIEGLSKIRRHKLIKAYNDAVV